MMSLMAIWRHAQVQISPKIMEKAAAQRAAKDIKGAVWLADMALICFDVNYCQLQPKLLHNDGKLLLITL